MLPSDFIINLITWCSSPGQHLQYCPVPIVSDIQMHAFMLWLLVVWLSAFAFTQGWKKSWLKKNLMIFGRLFVKWFALCYRSIVCPVLPCPVCPVCHVCDVRTLWPNGWTDQDETWLAGRPRPRPHCVRVGPSSPSPKGTQPPNFWPISVAAKWLHGSRCHLVWR